MELNHLKYFYYVAREGGFSKAARALRIAQPAITKMVKNLESELDMQLLERSGKSISLTKQGSDVYRKCELIFAHVEDIRRSIPSKTNKIAGPLSFGAAEPIAHYVVPNALQAFRQTHSAVYPQMITATASEIARLVSSHKLDFALLFHAPELPENLQIAERWPVLFKLVVSSNKKSDDEVCSTFIGSREVDNIPNKTYPSLERLRTLYPMADIKISTNSLSAHKKMVLAGLGVAVLPAFMVDQDIAAGHLTALVDANGFNFDLKVIHRNEEKLSLAADAFLTDVKSVLDEMPELP